MKLQDAIVQILLETEKVLSIQDITDYLNQSDLYVGENDKSVDRRQVSLCVNKYSKIFDYINGKIILTSDKTWKNLLSTYWYLKDILFHSTFSQDDLKLILAALLFFKRVRDMDRLDHRIQASIHNIPDLFFDLNLNDAEEISQHINGYHGSNSAFGIYHDTVNLLRQLHENTLFQILQTLNRFETVNYSVDDFGPIFEFFLHDILGKSSNLGDFYRTPKYLQNLMASLLAPEPGRNIYDPASGSSGLLIEALGLVNGNLHAKGNELSHRMIQFGYMNLVMNGFFDVNLIQDNFFEDLNNSNRYDYIIGDIVPRGFLERDNHYRLFNKWGIEAPKKNKGYCAPVLFVLSKMAEKGKAVITVSDTLLFKGGKEKEVRELLIQKDVIESVVSLPVGALRPYTNAKSSILVLNYDKPFEFKGKIKFIESVSTYSDSKSIDIKPDDIVSLYRSKSQESRSTYKVIEQEKLTEDRNLSVHSYRTELILAKEMLSSGSALKLKDIVEICSGANIKQDDYNPDAQIPVVKIENLSRDIFDLYLDLEAVNQKTGSHSKYTRSLLAKECILVARIGEQLKPAYFRPSKEIPKILIHNGLFALIPKKKGNVVDLEYLYYRLHDEFVLDQIKGNRMGTVMSSISISRLKEVIIPYAELGAQKKFVSSQKASIIAAERGKIEERIKALGYEEAIEKKESDIVRTLVHQLRPTLSGIDLQVKSFKRIVKKYNLTDKREFDNNHYLDGDPELEGIISKPENNTLGELIKRFESDTLHLNNVLNTVNDVMNFNINYNNKEETDIFNFIENYFKQHLEKEKRIYDIKVKGDHVTLLIHHSSFRELLELLIINAERHGFYEGVERRKKFEIIFCIKKKKDRPVAIIEYQNNGKPFNLTEKEYVKLFTKSQRSKGSGIGGNYIYRIIKAHGGGMKIDENFRSGFRMNIEIPLLEKD